jgi:phospholipase C
MFSRRTFLQIMGASGAAIFTANLSKTLAFAASPASNPTGSNGIEHIVVLMMENRSFDHFLSWLPGANGVNNLTFPAYNGYTYPNYPLAPDYQGCGYSDPDHSWEGWLLQSNGGQNNGFLMDPTTPAGIPGVTLAAANTFPVGYYTETDLPVIGALAQQYLTLDNYFCAFAGETYPNRFYQHCGQTDRDHNSLTASTLPSIWDQLTPFAPGTAGNNPAQPWGGYFYRDSPFLALWYSGAITSGDFKYVEFFHAFAGTDPAPIVYPGNVSFLDACAAGPAGGLLPNVCFVDPAFENGTVGTGGDDHPNSDIRLGERFIADAYHALADNGWLDNTVLIVTFDEWGGFYDHVPPPQVIDDTNPANVNHTGDSTTPTDGQLVPNYKQLGFRVPAIVVSNLLTPGQVSNVGPFEHDSTLALIESTFGLNSLTARDANANNLAQLLLSSPVAAPVNPTSIPTSSDVMGPVLSPVLGSTETETEIIEGIGNFDPADICSATSTQSVSPAAIGPNPALPEFPITVLGVAVAGTAGMLALNQHYRKVKRLELAALDAPMEVAANPEFAPPGAEPDVPID